MSKIFDALRRSEGERQGSEPVAVPQGPELLREAERHAASNWEAVVSMANTQVERTGAEPEVFSPELLSTPPAAVPSFSTFPRQEVERAALLDRFSSLPISISAESRLVCLQEWKSPTAEAVRLLAVRLRDIRRSRMLKKVVITSTVPREGKSTIASNLACALAKRGDEKVLLVEGDVRRPVVSELFGLGERPGLCELLTGHQELADSVYLLRGAGIWLLPAGKSGSNPLELLQSNKLPLVMDQLASEFNWIIVDTPPVLPLADTSIWMRSADGVLLVTRLGVTEKKNLEKGLEALEPQKILGTVLNGAQASRYSSYYYSESVNA